MECNRERPHTKNLHMSCLTVADKIQGKTPEQLHRYEDLKKVMTLCGRKGLL
jgi:hypothetical protein